MDSTTLNIPDQAAEVLKSTFGFTSLRAGQGEVIRCLLAGRSSLAVFPTGSGKSLCYQLPALVLDGLTVVVSPLIALMKGQIDFLQSKGIAAARLDSSLTRDENLQVFDDLHAGRTQLLYVSPERFGNERFLKLLEQVNVALLAVDEAHCISQWGHNFRPDYLRIASLASKLSIPRVLALTATATPEVSVDIAEAFSIDEGDVVQTGFYRPNLHLHATPCKDDHERRQRLVERIKSRPVEPAIVYVTLQRTAEQVAETLMAAGIKAKAYHAGLGTERRAAIQDEFMAAGDQVIVATIAFGMGIDKANIRAVYHYNLPKGLESYMQEIGRAGRDGLSAHCELFGCADDVITLENFSYGDTPTRTAVANLVDEVLGPADAPHTDYVEVSHYELSHHHDVRDLVVRTLLTYLELENVLRPTGALFTQYRFKPLRSSAEILARFDDARASFIANVFKQSKRGRTWLTIDVAQASKTLGEPRDRIIAALDYLDQRGDLTLESTGIRHGYHIAKQVADRQGLVDLLVERFSSREQDDLERIQHVVTLAEADECLTQTLLAYFGEHRSSCGHCDRCLGGKGRPLVAAPPELVASDRKVIEQIVAERHEALATARQTTRFLCGVTSPAASRAKLRGHPSFGKLTHLPFGDVLAVCEELGLAD
ncbi:RecQ family ATP-dependent DNA helicase [Aeoliella mucimassa]|uniref:RecQ family ATP-dependent DNA helicase n=1 Tax=Aeoliella mucimassa TaxID=2527972 RepID=UPI0018D4757F|nr:ATP-dependent DNA helicase RecQ [Aeoliella mucimassa]